MWMQFLFIDVYMQNKIDIFGFCISVSLSSPGIRLASWDTYKHILIILHYLFMRKLFWFDLRVSYSLQMINNKFANKSTNERVHVYAQYFHKEWTLFCLIRHVEWIIFYRFTVFNCAENCQNTIIWFCFVQYGFVR